MIEIILAGIIYYEYEGKVTKFGRGTTFWHLPGEKTIHVTSKSNPYKCLSIKFQTSYFLDRQVPEVTKWKYTEELSNFGEEIINSFYGDFVDKRFLAQYAYHKILWTANSNINFKKDYPEGLLKMIKFLENNFSTNLLIDDIADASGVSPSYLYSFSKKYLNMSPHKYLNNIRMQTARRMLIESDERIKTIAFECGFDNIETFLRAFKKHFYITPGKYRIKYSFYPKLYN